MLEQDASAAERKSISAAVTTNTQISGLLSSRRFISKAEVDNEAGKKTKAIIVTVRQCMVSIWIRGVSMYGLDSTHASSFAFPL